MEEKKSCDLLNNCPFFNDQMDMPKTLDICKNQYCKGHYETCARYQVAKAIGREKIPKDLYPFQNDRVKDILSENE